MVKINELRLNATNGTLVFRNEETEFSSKLKDNWCTLYYEKDGLFSKVGEDMFFSNILERFVTFFNKYDNAEFVDEYLIIILSHEYGDIVARRGVDFIELAIHGEFDGSSTKYIDTLLLTKDIYLNWSNQVTGYYKAWQEERTKKVKLDNVSD